MVAATQVDEFIGYVNAGAIDWANDTWKLALTSVAPGVAYKLSQLTEIDYTNLSARTVTISDASQTGGTFTATADQLALSATGPVEGFQYWCLYNDTHADKPIATWWDYGSVLTLAGGDAVNFGSTATFPVWVDEPAP